MHRTNIPVVILLLLSPSTLFAQQDSVTAMPSTALTFSFSGFNLGGGLGGKLALGSDFVLRPEVRFGFYKSDDDTPLIYGEDRHSYTTSSAMIVASLEKHFPASRALSPYCGLTSGVNWSQSRQTTESLRGTSSSVEKSWGIQGGIFAGVEYWITDHITLAGEQTILAHFRWSHERNYKNMDLGNSTSSLLLSVYF